MPFIFDYQTDAGWIFLSGLLMGRGYKVVDLKDIEVGQNCHGKDQSLSNYDSRKSRCKGRAEARL
jgi:hypothetical protein